MLTVRPIQKDILKQITKPRTGQQVGMKSRQTGHWIKRWLSNQDRLVTIEAAETRHPNNLLKEIEAVLSNLLRSGASLTFSAEQVARILSVACEDT